MRPLHPTTRALLDRLAPPASTAEVLGVLQELAMLDVPEPLAAVELAPLCVALDREIAVAAANAVHASILAAKSEDFVAVDQHIRELSPYRYARLDSWDHLT